MFTLVVHLFIEFIIIDFLTGLKKRTNSLPEDECYVKHIYNVIIQ